MYRIEKLLSVNNNVIIYSVIGGKNNSIYEIKETYPNFIEIDFLSRYTHNNIIKLIDFWIGKSTLNINDRDVSLFIITESSNHNIINFKTDSKLFSKWDVIIDMIKVVHFIHNNCGIHGNINPNAFIIIGSDKNGYKVKLKDFTLSSYHNIFINGNQDIKYLAPEILNKYYNANIKNIKPNISAIASDLWALGITILYYIIGYHPFDNNLYDKMNSYIEYPILYLATLHIPELWRPLILFLLDLDQNKRISNMKYIAHLYNLNSKTISIKSFPIDDYINKPPNQKDIIKLFSKVSSNNKHALINNFNNTFNHDIKFFSESDLSIIDFNANKLIKILIDKNFDIEVLFIAIDLYYRCIHKLGFYVKEDYIIIACIYLALQLGNNYIIFLDQINKFICNKVNINKIIYTAGYITVLLKGKLYNTNLYTGVTNIDELSGRILLLYSCKTYLLSRKILSRPHNIKKLRFPINFLI